MKVNRETKRNEKTIELKDNTRKIVILKFHASKSGGKKDYRETRNWRRRTKQGGDEVTFNFCSSSSFEFIISWREESLYRREQRKKGVFMWEEANCFIMNCRVETTWSLKCNEQTSQEICVIIKRNKKRCNHSLSYADFFLQYCLFVLSLRVRSWFLVV